jgi:anti-sigma regulatory factor (Ser/Thr protein kinase)
LTRALRSPRSTRSTGAATELKIPADPQYVIVAKRAASALGSTAGFSLEGIDDLNIAVAQACEKAIAAADHMWGRGNGVLRLTFHIVDEGIEVEVRSMAVPEAGTDVESPKRRLEAERRAESYRQAAARLSDEVESERQSRLRAQRQLARLAGVNRRITGAALTKRQVKSEGDFDDLAVNMIRLFVDELRYNVDSRGAMRMRMVKYHVD